MATTALKGNPVNTVGDLPPVGAPAPGWELVAADLSQLTHEAAEGQRVVLNIFPSVDTGVCAASVRRFNELAAGLPDTDVINVSVDLPFAQARFCGAEGVENVTNLSTFRSPDFSEKYGVAIKSGSLAGLNARAVVVLDENNKVLHSELVSEIANEPNYDAALAALK